MPELPEVETIRHDLERLVQGQTLHEIEVRERVRLLQNTHPDELGQRLVGRVLERIARRGKYLLWGFGPETLVLHLRMSGRILTRPAEHTRLTLTFEDTPLHLDDARRFAMAFLAPTDHLDELAPLGKLGLDPFGPDYTHAAFRSLLASSQEIKRLLLDQTKIAGLGNIYANEALFVAGVHPERPACSLEEAEARALWAAIPSVLERAIAAGGTSMRSYATPDGTLGRFQQEFAVYGRTGEPCPGCDAAVERIIQGGRSSFCCPQCQPKFGHA